MSDFMTRRGGSAWKSGGDGAFQSLYSPCSVGDLVQKLYKAMSSRTNKKGEVVNEDFDVFQASYPPKNWRAEARNRMKSVISTGKKMEKHGKPMEKHASEASQCHRWMVLNCIRP